MFSFIIARDFHLKHNSKVPVCFKLFRGSPALSEFRIQGLMQKFQQNQLPVKSVYAEYLHFVELNRPLISEQEAKLKALLHYGPTLAEHDAKGETLS